MGLSGKMWYICRNILAADFDGEWFAKFIKLVYKENFKGEIIHGFASRSKKRFRKKFAGFGS